MLGYTEYDKTFFNSEIQDFQQDRLKKDQIIGKGYEAGRRGDYRWIGYPGEVAFNDFLLDLYGEPTWDWHYQHDAKDFLDFTLGRLLIDVKTQYMKTADQYNTIYFTVMQRQIDKMLTQGSPDTFVFAKYIADEQFVRIFGWLSLNDFLERSWEQPVNPERNIHYPGRVISEKRLHKLIEIDRYK